MQPSMLLKNVCALLLGAALATPIVAAPEEPTIVAQDLKKMRIPGRLAAVLWTARKDYCTLQVVFPNMGRVMQVTKEDPQLKSHGSNVQVWLLKADGSLIPPLWRTPETPPKNPKNRLSVGPQSDVLFRFPLSAGKEAVAAAVQIGDTFLVDEIVPFKD